MSHQPYVVYLRLSTMLFVSARLSPVLQLPAVVSQGVTVVVCPLLSLVSESRSCQQELPCVRPCWKPTADAGQQHQ